jgi:hypothetical protein
MHYEAFIYDCRFETANFEGPVCDLKWVTEIKCRDITNCSECVAIYPPFKTAAPVSFNVAIYLPFKTAELVSFNVAIYPPFKTAELVSFNVAIYPPFKTTELVSFNVANMTS